jgi:hypothetical protein
VCTLQGELLSPRSPESPGYGRKVSRGVRFQSGISMTFKKLDFTMQKLITKKVQLNQDLVSVFNRYISAEIGLHQGHHQSEIQNSEVNTFLSTKSTGYSNFVVKGHKYLVIAVQKHNKGLQFVAGITFDEEMVNFIEEYIKYVREPIQGKSFLKSDNMCDSQPFLVELLQYDGKLYLPLLL